ncbi:MAG: hypothetical protein P8099_04745 [Gemmatimonadota bacterium]|jgi:hypothetical protein
MAGIIIAGLTLSVLAFVLLGYLLWDVLKRRRAFPSLTYGGQELKERTVRWLWASVLVIPFLISLESGLTVASKTTSAYEPATSADYNFTSGRYLVVPLPFLRYMTMENAGVVGDPAAPSKTVSVRVQEGRVRIPLIFLFAVGFYWAAVIRWTADSEAGVKRSGEQGA